MASFWVRLYARKSRYLGDPDDLDLMAHQVLPLRRAAEQRGIELEERHIILEVGSSETIEGRPDFHRLLREIERLPPGEGGILFVWEISRLSRGSRMERARIADALERAGILVVTPSQQYDLTDPDSDFMFALLSQQARREQVVYKRRIRDTREASLELGKIRNGRAPWGYVYDREAKTLAAHPARFPHLVAACREVLTQSVRLVAARHGVDPRVLQNTLTNPKICGWPALITGTSKSGAGTTRLPRHRWREAGRRNDTYPHACTREEFDRIQQVLAHRAKTKLKTKGEQGWCRDLVWFPEAPGPVVLGATGADGSRSPRLLYERREKQDGRWKRLAYIERETVHAAAYAALMGLLTAHESLPLLARAYEEHQRHIADQKAAEGSQERLQERAADLRRRYREAVEAEFDASWRLREALTERRLRLEAELDELEERLAQMSAEAEPDPGVLLLLESLPSLGEAIRRRWEEWTDPRRRELANLLIRRIVCHSEPQARGQPWKRWVERIEWQPWVPV